MCCGRAENCLEKEITAPGAQSRPQIRWIDKIMSWTGLSFNQLLEETRNRCECSWICPCCGQSSDLDNLLTKHQSTVPAELLWEKDLLNADGPSSQPNCGNLRAQVAVHVHRHSRKLFLRFSWRDTGSNLQIKVIHIYIYIYSYGISQKRFKAV